MRTLIQRVQHASVTIDGQLKSKIGKGLLVLVGICLLYTSDAADEL